MVDKQGSVPRVEGGERLQTTCEEEACCPFARSHDSCIHCVSANCPHDTSKETRNVPYLPCSPSL